MGALALLLLLSGCLEPPPRLEIDEYGAKFDTGPPTTTGGDDVDVVDPGDIEDALIDGTQDEVDTPPPIDIPPDVPPPCVPDPLPGDPCDGVDNDCDGFTDEDGGPPAGVEDFTIANGWLRKSPAGVTNHLTGLVPFAGYPDADTVVWLETVPWSGDLQLDVRLVLTQIADGTEFFIGTWSGEGEPDPPAGRTGVSIVKGSDNTVVARALVSDEVVASAEAQPTEFLQVMLRVSTQFDRVTLRLLRGDGSLVSEGVANDVQATPSHNGLAIAVLGGPIVGSVTRIELGPGLDCQNTPEVECAKGLKCPAVPPCHLNLCNPFLGCMDQELHCALQKGCLGASTCDVDLNACTEPEPLGDGTGCDGGQGCVVGSTCAGGVCQGGEPKVCDAPGQCQLEASCSVLTNQCEYPNLDPGTPCDDGSLCTGADQCQAGECLGTPKECPTNQACENESTCSAETGECSEVLPLPDGSACDDGDGCTINDSCTEAACGGEENPCDDGLECTLDACADGGCSHEPSEACLVFETELAGPVTGAPAYAGAAIWALGGGLFALTPDGGVVWQSDVVTQATNSVPVLSGAGTRLYVGDLGADEVARVAAISAADGSLVWEHIFESESCVAGLGDPCRVLVPITEGPDGTIYASTESAGVFAITGAGGAFWQFPDSLAATSVVPVGGNLYVGQGGPPRGVQALNAAGQARWLHVTGSDVRATPVVAGTSIYYLAGGEVGALNETGEAADVIWSLELQTLFGPTQPVIDAAGHLIVASDTALWAIDVAACDGTIEACVVYSQPLDSGPSAGLSALSDGSLAHGGAGGLVVRDNAGIAGYTLAPEGVGLTSPLVVDSGLLIVGGSDGKLRGYAYTPGTTPAASPWPVFNKKQQRNPTQ